jgi:FtsP/CotA-like multicopper oxidase with cupredoxin domain
MVLLIGLVAVVLGCGGGAALVGVYYRGLSTSTAGKVRFANRLAVPPLAPSHVDGSGRRVFDLVAAPGTHDFGHGRTPTWGFNGGYLGPTLRAARGEQVLVNVRNDLGEETTMHWHGMHLPAAMDGGPHQPIPPGTTWSPTWRIDQPAATLWYHPHPHGETARHVYRGLAGLFITDDPATEVAALPHEYGVDDVPLIVQDKSFDGAGRLDTGTPFLSGVGILGDTVAVNGTVGAYLDVRTDRVRLRLLNASNARSYDFGFADGRRFALVGTDGGLLPAPVDTDRIMLSPGERAEIVVTVQPGERTVLRSFPPDLGVGSVSGRMNGGADTFDILELRAAATLAPRPAVPAHLVDVPRLNFAAAAQTRSFALGDSEINGRSMEMTRIDAVVVKDTTEVWTVTNRDGAPHNFHVHDVQFQVLSVGGHAPPPELGGWKDTVYLPAGQPVTIVARFADYADPDSPYMFHCHVLRHEDRGLMGQFVVVNAGQQPGTPHRHS